MALSQRDKAARAGIAALRRLSSVGKPDCAEVRAQRTKRAVIAYMREKGLIAHWFGEGGRLLDGKVRVECAKLPWNEAALPRACAVVLWREVSGYLAGRRWIAATTEEVERVAVPNWEYDGVDPLIAREPYEREEAHWHLDAVQREIRWTRERASDDACEEAGAAEMREEMQRRGFWTGAYLEAAD